MLTVLFALNGIRLRRSATILPGLISVTYKYREMSVVLIWKTSPCLEKTDLGLSDLVTTKRLAYYCRKPTVSHISKKLFRSPWAKIYVGTNEFTNQATCKLDPLLRPHPPTKKNARGSAGVYSFFIKCTFYLQ